MLRVFCEKLSEEINVIIFFLFEDTKNMSILPVAKNKLKIGSSGRYYGAYLIYDVANSCLAKISQQATSQNAPVLNVKRVAVLAQPKSAIQPQNPRKNLKKKKKCSINFLHCILEKRQKLLCELKYR